MRGAGEKRVALLERSRSCHQSAFSRNRTSKPLLVGDGSGKTGARRSLFNLGNVRWYIISMHVEYFKLAGRAA